MSLSEFSPNEEELFLIYNLFDGNIRYDISVCAADITSDQAFVDLIRDGTRYIVSTEAYPAWSVLRHSGFVTQISKKVASPHSVGLFELVGSRSFRRLFRRNPEDFDLDSLLSAASLRSVITAEAFEGKKGTYGQWRKAWWREVLQNSVDACLQATRDFGRRGEIICSLYEYEGSDRVEVEVEDNGVGMDMATLRKAFLTPGGSAKRGKEGNVGGLGKAKEMLFHAWPEWSVWTQTDSTPGIFFSAIYGPYVNEENILAREQRNRRGPGTTVRIVMKQDDCVKKEDLLNFIDLSAFALPIRVTFKKYIVSGDTMDIVEEQRMGKTFKKLAIVGEVAKLVESERLKAANKITVDRPIITFNRPDGSPWAKAYHMPKARKFAQIIVRNHGLYLFTVPGTYDISGKIIIELLYKPKAKIWDGSRYSIDMGQEEASKQCMTDYGPLELLTESREKLKDTFETGKQYSWQEQDIAGALTSWLTSIIKAPKATLRRRRKQRKRVTNRKKNNSLDFDKIFQIVDPVEIFSEPDKAFEKLKDAKERNLLVTLIDKVSSGEVDLNRPKSMQKNFGDGDIDLLKILAKNGDLIPKMKELQMLTISKKQAITEEKQIIVDSGDEDREEPSPEIAELFEDLDIEEISEDLIEAVKEAKFSSISTAVEPKLYDLYQEILKPVIEEAASRGSGRNYAENIVKMLQWEPDFHWSDETAGSPIPLPKAPADYDPEHLGKSQKGLAKFTVEAIRLIYMLKGNVDTGLDVGFLFDVPGSDEWLGKFESSEGGSSCARCDEELVAGVSECPECGEPNTTDVGAFRAIFVAPAKLSDSTGSWVHRYSLGANSKASYFKFVALCFHEVTHADQFRNTSRGDAVNTDHNTTFANMITDYIPTAMIFQGAFTKLAEYCRKKYPMRERRGRGEGPKAPRKIPMAKKRGFYSIGIEGKRGRRSQFATLQEARDFVRDYQETNQYADCQIYAHYRPESGRDIDIDDIDRSYMRGDDWSMSTQKRLLDLRYQWDNSYKDSFMVNYEQASGEDIFKRRRKRRLRRYNPGF